jgi:hypothetical protein
MFSALAALLCGGRLCASGAGCGEAAAAAALELPDAGAGEGASEVPRAPPLGVGLVARAAGPRDMLGTLPLLEMCGPESGERAGASRRMGNEPLGAPTRVGSSDEGLVCEALPLRAEDAGETGGEAATCAPLGVGVRGAAEEVLGASGAAEGALLAAGRGALLIAAAGCAALGAPLAEAEAGAATGAGPARLAFGGEAAR